MRRRMGGNVGFLRTLTLIHRLFHFIAVAQVECNHAFNLIQAQRRVVRLDRLSILAIVVLPYDPVDRHTATYDVEASLATLYVVACHGLAPIPVYHRYFRGFYLLALSTGGTRRISNCSLFTTA